MKRKYFSEEQIVTVLKRVDGGEQGDNEQTKEGFVLYLCKQWTAR